MLKKIVLAYSGGLDTSVILKWLQEKYQCPVVTFTADLGQGEELSPVRSKAESLGVKEVFIEDLREDFVQNYVFPMFRANAIYEGTYFLGTAIARPLIAKRQIEIANEVGAFLLADISHPSGMIATGLLSDPIPHCHVVTTTTHKTLRGPRGGLILMGEDFDNPFGVALKNGTLRKMSHLLDMAVFPGNQGGPLEHIVAAKAIAFGEALKPEFKAYMQKVKKNANAMAEAFISRDYHLISEGTDNHMMLIDLRNKNITGKAAEQALVKAEITANKNMVPFDDKSPFVTSGIRFGTAAITTRGLNEKDMVTVVDLIDRVISDPENVDNLSAITKEVKELMRDRPLFIA